MKKYPVIKYAKTQFYTALIFSGIFALAALISNIVIGIKVFPDISVLGIIMFEILFVLIFSIAITAFISVLRQKSLGFSSVGYDENGIHIFDAEGRENRIYKWADIAESGVITAASETHEWHGSGNGSRTVLDIVISFIIDLFFTAAFNPKVIYFSEKKLDKNAKKRCEIKIEKTFLSVQYNEESLFDIKKYYPDFNIEVEHLRN